MRIEYKTRAVKGSKLKLSLASHSNKVQDKGSINIFYTWDRGGTIDDSTVW